MFWRESPVQLPTIRNRLHHNTTDAAAITFSDWVEMTIEKNWFWHGFGLMTSHEEAGDLPKKCVAVAMPDWFLVVALLALPARWVTSRVFGGRRLAETACTKCGYDIRASSERCPECGHPISDASPLEEAIPVSYSPKGTITDVGRERNGKEIRVVK